MITDFISDFSQQQLGALFLDTGEYRCADGRPTRVRRRVRDQLWLPRVCKSCALVARELPPLFFDEAVPELVCSGKRLAGLLASAEDPVLLDEYVPSTSAGHNTLTTERTASPRPVPG